MPTRYFRGPSGPKYFFVRFPCVNNAHVQVAFLSSEIILQNRRRTIRAKSQGSCNLWPQKFARIQTSQFAPTYLQLDPFRGPPVATECARSRKIRATGLFCQKKPKKATPRRPAKNPLRLRHPGGENETLSQSEMVLCSTANRNGVPFGCRPIRWPVRRGPGNSWTSGVMPETVHPGVRIWPVSQSETGWAARVNHWPGPFLRANPILGQ